MGGSNRWKSLAITAQKRLALIHDERRKLAAGRRNPPPVEVQVGDFVWAPNESAHKEELPRYLGRVVGLDGDTQQTALVRVRASGMTHAFCRSDLVVDGEMSREGHRLRT